MSVETGKVVAVLGPSGSGKTTMLRCISFLERADQGTVGFDDEFLDMSNWDKKQIRNIRMRMGFVSQSLNLFMNMTALENVMEGLVTARKMDKEVAKKKALDVIERVGLLDKVDYYPQHLSGGQQQRIAIARALAADPEIILFDEPTSALDPELTAEVLSTIKRLADEGTTMLIVTHEMEFAASIADEVVFIENGEIIEKAPAKEFFTSPKHKRSIAFVEKSYGHSTGTSMGPDGATNGHNGEISG